MDNIMTRLWLVACMLQSIVTKVESYPTGAPAAACTRIYPEGHNGTSQNLQSSPFVLDISQFYNQLGNLYYTPGYNYTLTLTGGYIRGFLIQAISSVSGTPLGTFSVGNDGSQQLSQCSPPESAVTQTNNSVKSNVSLTWTAPAARSGPIVFLFAVVMQNSAGISTFYATLNSSNISEGCADPLYLNGSTCVTSCPPYYYGNYTSRLCLPLPNGYTNIFNATFYELTFLNTTPVGSVLFGFTLYVNPAIVPLGSSVILTVTGSIGSTQFASDHFVFSSASSYVYPRTILSSSDYVIMDSIFYKAITTLSTFTFNIQSLVPPNGLVGANNVGVTIIDICQANPCYNGGTCVYIGNSTTTCTCAPGFNGTNCSNDINYCTQTTCLNGGTCYDGYGTYTNCTCAPGFNGTSCSNDINYCTPTTCLNGGTCFEGYGTLTSCVCAPGFSGNNCSIDLPFCTSMTCKNGGTCVEGYGTLTSCICALGFSGNNNCSIDLPFCTSTTCKNGGTCVEAYGTLTSCICAPRFSGTDCSIDLNYCTPTTCLNGGTCVEGYGTLTSCICAPGFNGTSCSDDINYCTPTTCLNGGTCVEGYGTSTSCVCAPGTGGIGCTTSSPPTSSSVPTAIVAPPTTIISIGVIVGIVVGSVLLLLLIMAAVVCTAISCSRTRKYNISSVQDQNVMQLQSLDASKSDPQLENNIAYGFGPQLQFNSDLQLGALGQLQSVDISKGDSQILIQPVDSVYVETNINGN